MKLEGLDPSHPSLFCVLTVAEVRILTISCLSSSEIRNFILTDCFHVVIQIQGYRVRLHFDGYPECYDFWANADSWDLKPAGWCEKNGHKLLLPKGNPKHDDLFYMRLETIFSKNQLYGFVYVTVGCKEGEFNWSTYVKNCRGQLAPKHLFKSLNTVSPTQTMHHYII